MPEALRTRLRLTPEDVLPATDFELNSATDAMSAFEQICLAIPASGALIAVRDASGLRSVGSLGDAPEVGSHLPPDFGMAIECLETRSAVYRDLTDDAQRVLSVGLSMEGVSQVRSAVALPMRAEKAQSSASSPSSLATNPRFNRATSRPSPASRISGDR